MNISSWVQNGKDSQNLLNVYCSICIFKTAFIFYVINSFLMQMKAVKQNLIFAKQQIWNWFSLLKLIPDRSEWISDPHTLTNFSESYCYRRLGKRNSLKLCRYIRTHEVNKPISRRIEKSRSRKEAQIIISRKEILRLLPCAKFYQYQETRL